MRKPLKRSGRKALRRLERSLPGSWYRDPAHYERELEAFWRRRWIAAGREEELSAPGDWRAVRIGGESIVLARGEDAKVRAFYNVCRHRGSVLCTAEEGHFERKRIVCPYHSWAYDLKGKLIATPRRMETPQFDMAQFPLHEVAVESWGGFLFVRLDGRQKLDLGEPGEKLKNYRIKDLRIGRRIVANVKANWKLLAENFSECFHCPPVHPELCRVVTAYREAGAWGLRGGETTPEYKPGAQTLTLDGSARIPPLKDLSKSERETLYVPWMLPPNLFLNIQPDYVNSHLMFPTGPESVRIVYDWLFEPGNMPKGADLEHYTALWEITNKQDAQNCE